MPTRTEVLESLQGSLEKLERGYRSIPAPDLARTCTESEVSGAQRWTPLDHLAHLIQIEDTFLQMCRATADGDERPITWEGTTREEILAYVHRMNQRYVESKQGATVDELLGELSSARARTREFIDSVADETLAMKVPGAPWNDGTIAGVLHANSGHAIMHKNWVDEGLSATASS